DHCSSGTDHFSSGTTNGKQSKISIFGTNMIPEWNHLNGLTRLLPFVKDELARHRCDSSINSVTSVKERLLAKLEIFPSVSQYLLFEMMAFASIQHLEDSHASHCL
ncbi:hypothetical protein KI387_016842, partial [Taxus chinensis]